MTLIVFLKEFFENINFEKSQQTKTKACKITSFVFFREPSLSEKQAYADSLVKLEEAQKYLGQAYCVLVLGLGLEQQHHMSCGM